MSFGALHNEVCPWQSSYNSIESLYNRGKSSNYSPYFCLAIQTMDIDNNVNFKYKYANFNYRLYYKMGEKME